MCFLTVFLYPTKTLLHCTFPNCGTNKGTSYLSSDLMSSNPTAIERSDHFYKHAVKPRAVLSVCAGTFSIEATTQAGKDKEEVWGHRCSFCTTEHPGRYHVVLLDDQLALCQGWNACSHLCVCQNGALACSAAASVFLPETWQQFIWNNSDCKICCTINVGIL